MNTSCCVFTQTPNPIKVTAGNLFDIFFLFLWVCISHNVSVHNKCRKGAGKRGVGSVIGVLGFFFCFNLKWMLCVQKCMQCISVARQSLQFNLFTKIYQLRTPLQRFLPQNPSSVQSISVKTVLIFIFRRLKSSRS